MDKQQLNRVIENAHDVCTQSGKRLTEKRKGVLELLLVSDTPLSAYEIAHAYNQTAKKPMPTMSVYRILEFLEAADLVHKLSSTHKYVPCAHIACDHVHGIPQFLICGKCQSAREIAVSTNIIDELAKLVVDAGYTLKNPQLELQCLCNDCSAGPA